MCAFTNGCHKWPLFLSRSLLRTWLLTNTEPSAKFPSISLGDKDLVRYFKNNSFSVSLNTRLPRSLSLQVCFKFKWNLRILTERTPERACPIDDRESNKSFHLQPEMLCWEEKRNSKAKGMLIAGADFFCFAPHHSHMLKFTIKTLKLISVIRGLGRDGLGVRD